MEASNIDPETVSLLRAVFIFLCELLQSGFAGIGTLACGATGFFLMRHKK